MFDPDIQAPKYCFSVDILFTLLRCSFKLLPAPVDDLGVSFVWSQARLGRRSGLFLIETLGYEFARLCP